MDKFGKIKDKLENKEITIKEAFDAIKSNMLVNDLASITKEYYSKKIKAEAKNQQKIRNSLEI